VWYKRCPFVDPRDQSKQGSYTQQETGLMVNGGQRRGSKHKNRNEYSKGSVNAKAHLMASNTSEGSGI
jgi:hypothetical protein